MKFINWVSVLCIIIFILFNLAISYASVDFFFDAKTRVFEDYENN